MATGKRAEEQNCLDAMAGLCSGDPLVAAKAMRSLEDSLQDYGDLPTAIPIVALLDAMKAALVKIWTESDIGLAAASLLARLLETETGGALLNSAAPAILPKLLRGLGSHHRRDTGFDVGMALKEPLDELRRLVADPESDDESGEWEAEEEEEERRRKRFLAPSGEKKPEEEAAVPSPQRQREENEPTEAPPLRRLSSAGHLSESESDRRGPPTLQASAASAFAPPLGSAGPSDGDNGGLYWEKTQEQFVSFTCCDCRETCTDRDALDDHRRRYHSGDPFQCPRCWMTFGQKFNRNRHVERKVCEKGVKKAKAS